MNAGGIPHVASDFIRRDRLVDRLDDALSKPLAVVIAPAGFGATATVADWCRKLDGQGACEASWTDLSNRWPRQWGEGAPQRRSLSGSNVIEEIVSTAKGRAGHVVAVVDGAELLDGREVETLSSLMVDPQSRLHIVLICSRPPDLPLTLIAARDQCVMIARTDLSFTASEIAEIAWGNWHARCGSADAEALRRLTDGWLVAVRAACLAMRDTRPGKAVEAMSRGEDETIGRYISEALAELGEDAADAIGRASFAGQVDRRLASDALGAGDYDALEAASASGSIVIDEGGGRYSIPPIFALPLSRHYAARHAEGLADLYRGLVAHHVDSGAYVRALRCFASFRRWTDPEDSVAVGDAIADAAIPAVFSGVDVGFESLEESDENALTLAVLAAAALRENDSPRAERLLARTSSALERGGAEPGRLLQWVDALTLLALGQQGKVSSGLELASFLEEGDRSGDPLLASWMENCKGSIYSRGKDASLTLATYRASIDAAQAAGNALIGFLSSYLMAKQLIMLGRLAQAQATLDAARSSAEGDLPQAILGLYETGSALIAAEKGELARCAELLGGAEEVLDGRQHVEFFLDGRRVRAFLAEAQGDAGAARLILEEAADIAGMRHCEHMRAILLSDLASLEARQPRSDFANARATVSRIGVPESDFEAHVARELAVAQVLISDRACEEAESRLSALAGELAGLGRARDEAFARLLRAKALASDSGASAGALIDAVRLAAPLKIIRPFVLERRFLSALVADDRVRMRLLGDIDAGIVAFLSAAGAWNGGATAAYASSKATTGARGAAALTEREGDVYDHLLAGRSDAEIAAALGISRSTVHSHCNAIYAKLGVTGRRELALTGRAVR